jgi:hypothetical protein
MQRMLILVGLALVAAGLLWPWLARVPWGRLPGDITITRPGFTFHVPLGSCLLVSIVISLLAWWIGRR